MHMAMLPSSVNPEFRPRTLSPIQASSRKTSPSVFASRSGRGATTFVAHTPSCHQKEKERKKKKRKKKRPQILSLESLCFCTTASPLGIPFVLRNNNFCGCRRALPSRDCCYSSCAYSSCAIPLSPVSIHDDHTLLGLHILSGSHTLFL